jgi:sortase A
MADDPLSKLPSESSSVPQATPPEADLAASLLRQKVADAYGREPAAAAEMAEAAAMHHRRSPHQQFMYSLSNSGKDLAAIQTEWHNYYQSLPDNQKHQVWQEFYSSQSLLRSKPVQRSLTEHKNEVVAGHSSAKRRQPSPKLREARNSDEIKAAVRDKVTAGGQLQTKHHVQSLLFGLGMGVLVIFIFLFGFFNELFIAPFIQPSRAQAATPIIVNSQSVAPTANPEVIIPKINVEIPVNFDETSTNEATIENDLENGVVHYPTTVLPGQNGNTAFFGHSSNNIFNKGKYKFAFVLLHTLVNGDTFYLTYNQKVYVYKVISRTVVEPTEVGVLGPVPGQTATATLITCDPPGTSLHRLVVVGQQISPDPSGNTQPTTPQASSDSSTPTFLPGNGPTLWTRYIRTATGKVTTIIVSLLVLFLVLRWVNAPRRKLGSLKA